MTEQSVATVTVTELHDLFSKPHKPCLIDVREPAEWAEVHIPEAIHCPKGELATSIDSIMPDKNTPIYLHCRGGMRSIDAARILISKGYQQVYSVQGGINDWAAKGYVVKAS